MPRPPMVLTGPQAITIGILAGLAFTYRTSLRTAAHFVRCGPNFLGFFDDEDFDDFIAEQRKRLDSLADIRQSTANPSTIPTKE